MHFDTLHSNFKESKQEIDQIKKCREYLKHLTDSYLIMKQKYYLLHPMIFNNDLISKNQSYAFKFLRDTLFFNCVLDIVIMTKDTDKRTPSIEKIKNKLENQDFVKQLLEDFLFPIYGDVELESKYRQDFTTKLNHVNIMINDFFNSKQFKCFVDIRDKRIAHRELKKTEIGYEILDINSMNLTWNEFVDSIERIENILLDLNLIIRGLYKVDMRKEHCEKIKFDFWKIEA